MVHSLEYIQRLEATEGKESSYLDKDTAISALSHETALLAAGGICEAIRQVCNGELNNSLAMVRPPGHHAEKTEAKGFCLYNNVAIGAKYAQNKLGLKRILVVDWDLHHGNGTQHCFEKDPSVLFFSIHRAFLFPGSGRLGEIGKGAGKGLTINIPLLSGCGDGEYLTLLEAILRPVALEFSPELILVSAGFDIHFNDPMGGMRVTSKGFAGMTSCLLNIADECCGGKLVMTLEGGYDLIALKESIREVMMELIGIQVTDTKEMLYAADPEKIIVILWKVKKKHQRFWKNLSKIYVDRQEIPSPTLWQRQRELFLRIIEYFKS